MTTPIILYSTSGMIPSTEFYPAQHVFGQLVGPGRSPLDGSEQSGHALQPSHSADRTRRLRGQVNSQIKPFSARSVCPNERLDHMSTPELAQ